MNFAAAHDVRNNARMKNSADASMCALPLEKRECKRHDDTRRNGSGMRFHFVTLIW